MDKAKNLGLALIALSFIEAAWALFCVFGGLVLGAMGLVDDAMMLPMFVLSGTYGLLVLFNLPIAALHFFAGLRLRQGKGLILAIAALTACLPQMILALYCFPFEGLVLFYGIFVLADAEVRKQLDAD